MKTSKTIFICMFPGQKVFHFCENKLCSICRTKLYQILQRQLLMWVECCMKTKIYIYIFILSWGTMQITSTHNYVMHHVLRYFLQMQHCRIMNFNLHIVEVIFEMSLWIWTQVFLALETRIKPSDKQATCVLNESTSWVRSDVLSDVCVCPGEEHTYEGSLVDHYDNVVSPQPGEHSDSFCPFLPGRMWPAGSAFCAFSFSK